MKGTEHIKGSNILVKSTKTGDLRLWYPYPKSAVRMTTVWFLDGVEITFSKAKEYFKPSALRSYGYSNLIGFNSSKLKNLDRMKFNKVIYSIV